VTAKVTPEDRRVGLKKREFQRDASYVIEGAQRSGYLFTHLRRYLSMPQAISFPEADAQPAYSESGIPGVRPLPIKSFAGSSTSCWRFTPEEIVELSRTGVLWIATSVFEHQPILRVTLNKDQGLAPLPTALKGG
jgi:hypothetical protein